MFKKFVFTLSFFAALFLFSGVGIGTTLAYGTLPASMNLQTVNDYAVPYQNGIPVPSFDATDRTTINLSGTWKKERQSLNHDYSLNARDTAGITNIQTEAAGRHQANFNDSNWSSITLPAVENTMPSYESGTGPEQYQDGVWYRRHFTVDSALNSKYARLKFLSVNYTCDVWINGTYVGYHEGGYTPFAFDISSLLIYGADNVISVRVDNPPWGSRDDMVPTIGGNDWTNYTGIIQDMYIDFSDKLSVARADVKPKDIQGNINVKVIAQNANTAAINTTVSIQAYTANSSAAGYYTDPKASAIVGTQVSLGGTTSLTQSVGASGSGVFNFDVSISNPNLWSPKSPNLYVLKVTIQNGQTVTESFYTQFGIRTVKVGADAKILLNEQPIFLTAVARHEEWSDTGRTATMAKIKSDLDVIKTMNVNHLRTGHYPNHIYTYLLADRMGLSTTAEVPVWQFDSAQHQANNTRLIADQMWREMIFSNYNRPSILLWSTNNENRETTNRITYIKRVKNDLRTNYDDGRLVTQAAAGDAPGPHDASQNYVDVAGWTCYFGIFHGSNYYKGTADFLENCHKNYPDKPIIIYEIGLWSENAGSTNGSNESDQSKCARDTSQAVLERSALDTSGHIRPGGYVAGVTWFAAFNWYTRSTDKVQTMGLYHMDRATAKPAKDTVVNAFAPYYNLNTSQNNIIFQNLEAGNGTNTYYTAGGNSTVAFDTAKKRSGSRSIKLTVNSTGVPNTTTNNVTIYPYTNNTINMSNSKYLAFWIYDTVGSQTPMITLKDSSNNIYSVWAGQSSVRDQWTRILIPLNIIQTEAPSFNLAAVSEVRIGEFNSGDYYIDDITATTVSEDTYIWQNFDNTGDTAKLFTSGSDTTVTLEGNTKYYGVRGIKMVTTTSGDPGSNLRTARILPYYGSKMDLSGTSYLSVFVYDTQGSNTLKFFIKDASNNEWSGYSTNSTVMNQWTRIDLPLSNVSGVSLANITNIGLGMWNAGTYYFDQIIYSRNNVDDASELITQKSYQCFELMDDPAKAFSAASGVTSSYDTTVKRSGNKSLKMVLSSSGDPSTTTRSTAVKFNDPGVGKMDITAYGTLSFYVYDTQGNNTVKVYLQDANNSLYSVWSSAASVKNQWTRIDISLDSVSGIDKRNITAIYFGEWNQGTYYFDDLMFTNNTRRAIPNVKLITYQNFETGNGSAQYLASTTESTSSLDTTTYYDGSRGAKLQVLSSGFPSESWRSMIIYPQNSYGTFYLSGVNYLKFNVKDTQGVNSLHLTLFDNYNASNFTRIWTSETNPSIYNTWTQVMLPMTTIKGQYLENNKQLEVGEYNSGNYYVDGVTAVVTE